MERGFLNSYKSTFFTLCFVGKHNTLRGTLSAALDILQGVSVSGSIVQLVSCLLAVQKQYIVCPSVDINIIAG